MFKQGIINPQINHAISQTAHLDTVLVTDAAMEMPKGVERVDLAYMLGIPELLPIVKGLWDVCLFEKVYVAEEIKTASPQLFAEYEKLFSGVPIECVPHAELLKMTPSAKVAIRTGEDKYHYSSVLFVCGCPY